MKTISRANSAWREYSDQVKAMEEEIAAEEQYDEDAQRRLFNKQTEELKLLAPYPIASTDVPPETHYYNQTENGFTANVEVKTMPYLEALARFDGLDRDGNVLAPMDWQNLDPRAMALARSEWPRIVQQHKQITVIEAWDYQQCAIVLLGPGQMASASSQFQNGTLVRSIKHGYGDPVLKTLKGPYFLAHGLTTGSRLPEHRRVDPVRLPDAVPAHRQPADDAGQQRVHGGGRPSNAPRHLARYRVSATASAHTATTTATSTHSNPSSQVPSTPSTSRPSNSPRLASTSTRCCKTPRPWR